MNQNRIKRRAPVFIYYAGHNGDFFVVDNAVWRCQTLALGLQTEVEVNMAAYTKRSWFTRRWALAGAMLLMSMLARAEEYKLPDAAELALLPPPASAFYAAGLRALDRVDYPAAYRNFAKAAMLQPAAVRVNLIAAALAMKQGRSRPAAEAKNFYETAVACYKNVLSQPTLDDDMRRDVENRLSLAESERSRLAERDARREALGGQFIIDYNKEIMPTSTPKRSMAQPAPAAPTAAPAAPAMPAAAASAPAYPQAMPQFPGQQPQPSGMPQLPVPGAPQRPGAQPGAQPGFDPAGQPLI